MGRGKAGDESVDAASEKSHGLVRIVGIESQGLGEVVT